MVRSSFASLPMLLNHSLARLCIEIIYALKRGAIAANTHSKADPFFLEVSGSHTHVYPICKFIVAIRVFKNLENPGLFE